MFFFSFAFMIILAKEGKEVTIFNLISFFFYEQKSINKPYFRSSHYFFIVGGKKKEMYDNSNFLFEVEPSELNLWPIVMKRIMMKVPVP